MIFFVAAMKLTTHNLTPIEVIPYSNLAVKLTNVEDGRGNDDFPETGLSAYYKMKIKRYGGVNNNEIVNLGMLNNNTCDDSLNMTVKDTDLKRSTPNKTKPANYLKTKIIKSPNTAPKSSIHLQDANLSDKTFRGDIIILEKGKTKNYLRMEFGYVCGQKSTGDVYICADPVVDGEWDLERYGDAHRLKVHDLCLVKSTDVIYTLKNNILKNNILDNNTFENNNPENNTLGNNTTENKFNKLSETGLPKHRDVFLSRCEDDSRELWFIKKSTADQKTINEFYDKDENVDNFKVLDFFKRKILADKLGLNELLGRL